MSSISVKLSMFLVRNKSIPAAILKGIQLKNLGFRLAKWGLPLALIGAWMVFPAIPDSVRKQVGLPLYTPERYSPNAYKFKESEEEDEAPRLKGN